ncbi:hypothetical protein M405DRAFT_868358 [Rhizopogon salebrosus TDB-379]|nr:hypothetical protein M405DRAFT_868358 [Rhizopogon salebrosus TDB-379]
MGHEKSKETVVLPSSNRTPSDAPALHPPPSSHPPLLISRCSPHPPPIFYLSGVRPSHLVTNCAITALAT